MIYLTFNQLIQLGVNLGHSFLNSKFFSSWMLYGWRGKIFLFDMLYTIYLFRIGFSFIKKNVKIMRPIWFVNFNIFTSPFIARYSYASGESFSIYKWINGTLTNFKTVIGWGRLLYSSAIRNIYEFRHHDRKGLSSLLGFLFHKRRLPGTLLLPSVKDCENISDEFLSANIPTIGIVDSNTLSWSVNVPIPGNDDSFQCINFYCYLFSKIILATKSTFLISWDKLYRISKRRRRITRKLYLFFLINKYRYKLNGIEYNIDSFSKIFKNKVFFLKRYLTKYEMLFRSFVKNDIILKWKNS